MKRTDRTAAGSASAAAADLACACASARQLARVLTQLYDGRLRGAGIEAPQFALMMALERQGPCSQAAIGRRHAIDKTTISRNLKLLERNGWIESLAAGQTRERRFVLTAAGRKRLAGARPEWKKAQEQLRAGMTAREWAAMWRVFRTVTGAAQTAQRRGDARL